MARAASASRPTPTGATVPRQFGKVDVSATWAPCLRCPHKHPSHASCPPTGVWLVLALCPACNPTTGLYCRTHRDRHMPKSGIMPDPPAEDGQRLAAGEREDG